MSTTKNLLRICLIEAAVITGAILAAFSDVNPLIIAAIAVPSTIIMSLAFIGEAVTWSEERQGLTVSFPAIPSADREVSMLFVERDDYEIIRYLRKHGRTSVDGETTTVIYHGKRIYNATTNVFRLKGNTYRPARVRIESVSGFDPQT